MKRTGFKPRAQHREQRDPDRVRSVPTVAPGAFRAPEPVSEAPAAQVAKAAPVRSEAYRRAVAGLRCIHCGLLGYSQLIDRVSAFAATELGVTFPATFPQWEGVQVDPATGEIMGGTAL